jgi:hypothetical protein
VKFETVRTAILRKDDRRSWHCGAVAWWIALALATAAVLLLNPVGFLGGGWDDWQYLHAARCWREFGPCIPQDHWQARWPVIAPIAIITGVFGESRFTVGIAPFLASVACLVLLAKIANRLFGPPIGWLSALLLLITMAFSVQLLDPSVEATELAFVLAAFLAILKWREDPQWYWPFVAGMLFSLAIQVRETAAIATAFAAVYVVAGKPRPTAADLALAAIGFAIPFAIEFIGFWVTTGDPFWRVHLSIRHTLIPSTELIGPVDTAHSPFFNKSYIANWRREPGLHVYWAVDGLLNLFANGKAGLFLLLIPALLVVNRKTLPKAERRVALALWLSALGYASVLIYVLAVDPKARMMFVPLTMLSVALALITWTLKERGHGALAYASWGATALLGSVLLYGHQRTDIIEDPASSWIAAHPDQIEIDENTRRYLALVPDAEALASIDAERNYLLYNSITGCKNWLRINGLPVGALSVSGEAKISNLGWLDPRLSGALCLFRYNEPVTGKQIRAAIRRSRPDGAYMVGMRHL